MIHAVSACVLFVLGRERSSDLLAKSLRMIDGEVFKDSTLLDSSADIYMKDIPIEDLRDLLVDAEEHHEICKSAAEAEDEFLNEAVPSWAKSLEKTESDTSSKPPSKEMFLRYQKFWSALLLVGTVSSRIM